MIIKYLELVIFLTYTFLNETCLGENRRPFKCDDCGVKFTRIDSLKLHIKRFHSGKNMKFENKFESFFFCSKCVFAFFAGSNAICHSDLIVNGSLQTENGRNTSENEVVDGENESEWTSEDESDASEEEEEFSASEDEERPSTSKENFDGNETYS